MKTHHPWWPHLDFEPIFNPFVSILDRLRPRDPVDLRGIDEEEDERLRRSAQDHPYADKQSH